MERMRYAIAAGKIYTEDKIIENGVVIVENGSIVAIREKDTTLHAEVLYDCSEFQVLPGLIDTHIHGANGYDTMQADFTALNEISKYLATKGITAFVPTTVTDELPKIKRTLANIKACMGKVEGAQILGSYVEGPYITAEHRGAHPQKLIREIRLTEMEELIVASGDTVRTVALAPEKQNSLDLIKYLHQVGIHTAIGHTNATYEQVQQAAEAGADIAVHTYNGMRGFHHQEPGTLGAVLVNDKIYTELIADFTHAHTAAMEILLRCKPKDKVILISDAIEATGLSDGQYMLGTLQVVVKKGIARTESGSLAGSTTNILKCVQGLIEKMAVDPLSAVHMASLNPSKLLGVDSIIGSIKLGKQADFVVVDNNFEIVMTVVNGKVVYHR